MAVPALLILEDGTRFSGTSFGSEGETFGEAVFNTSMAGYQEILTDPSYIKQIVTMTSPMIGNYGILPEESESGAVQAAGFVVRECSRTFSQAAPGALSLDEYLKQNGTVGIEGVDTRRLTKHLREHGAMRAGISTTDLDPDSLLARVKASPSMTGLDLTREGSTTVVKEGTAPAEVRYRVAALDYGIKENILRQLAARGCAVTLFPADTQAETILAAAPDGLYVSNGPGDPAAAETAITTLKGLLGKLPVFGICLGHQLLCLALGGRTYKLKFGHRGGNHPVKNLLTGKIEISSQNHGFCVEEASLGPDVEITHINLNDNTVEGFRHKNYPLASVQYHPENAPGPHDSEYVFDEFTAMMDRHKGTR